MPYRLALLAILCGGGMLWVLGCDDGRVQRGLPRETCKAFIAEERLPKGWAVAPKSDMPPIDKTPWWLDNPQMLEGAALKEAVDIDGAPTAALRLWTIMYVREDDRVVLSCLTYVSAEQARAECRALTAGDASSEQLTGIMRGNDDAILIMHVPADCPDREYFVKHFDSVARPL